MAYSFRVVAATKDEAKAACAEKMAEVVAAHPAHQADAAHVLAAVDRMIDLVHQEPGLNIGVSVSGSISHTAEGITGIAASIGVGNVVS